MAPGTEAEQREGWFFSDTFAYVVLPFLMLGQAFELYASYQVQKSGGTQDTLMQILSMVGMDSPIVFLAAEKVIDIGISLLCYLLLRAYRRRYYPRGHLTFWEFFSSFLYGRPIARWQTLYSLPRLVPLLLYGCGINVLTFSYSYYVGYTLLAPRRGLPVGPSWTLGGISLDPVAIITAVLVTVYGARLLYQDYLQSE